MQHARADVSHKSPVQRPAENDNHANYDILSATGADIMRASQQAD